MLIGITMGDACGVGPEILVRSAAEKRVPLGECLVFGDRSAVDLAIEKCDVTLEVNQVGQLDEPLMPDALNLMDTGLISAGQITIGEISQSCGAASVEYVSRATQAALQGHIAAFVTLPINKEACRLSHPDFQGHTEFIAEMCATENYTMMLASPKMIVTHVSTHVSLREAIERVQTARVLEVIRLTAKNTFRLRQRARIAVAGLNPHAGEHGAFGTEDDEYIRPAVRQAQEEGIDAFGPLPADTLFIKVADGTYDAAVCMYHDQGHVPMKLHGFADAVNITVGLPVIRTSVDHGTAFDIAYQGIASIENFVTAYEMCSRLCQSPQ